MNVTPRKKTQMEIRRAAVARYKALGLSGDAIHAAIRDDGFRSFSGKVWSRTVIQLDLEYLKARYVLNADSDIAKWLDAELDVLNIALASALKGVHDKAKQVVGYRHVQKRDSQTGAMQEVKEPIFETVENLAAIDRVVKVAESRRRLLALDKIPKRTDDDREEIASAVVDRIADVFKTAAPGTPE